MKKISIFLLLVSIGWSCGPIPPYIGTKYDMADDYARGYRWYERGNHENAAKYWEPLAEKGDCDAEFWMGWLYFLGQGKPQDQAKAISLWQKAANGNHPKAQWALGDLYYQDEKGYYFYQYCKNCIFDKDIIQAYVWYKLSEKSARYKGETEYIERMIKAITTDMTSEEIAEGDRMVNSWKPTPKDCEPRKWW